MLEIKCNSVCSISWINKKFTFQPFLDNNVKMHLFAIFFEIGKNASGALAEYDGFERKSFGHGLVKIQKRVASEKSISFRTWTCIVTRAIQPIFRDIHAVPLFFIGK